MQQDGQQQQPKGGQREQQQQPNKDEQGERQPQQQRLNNGDEQQLSKAEQRRIAKLERQMTSPYIETYLCSNCGAEFLHRDPLSLHRGSTGVQCGVGMCANDRCGVFSGSD